MKYNTQQLLFDETPFVLTETLSGKMTTPESFVKNGFCVLQGIQTIDDAKEQVDQFIQSYDAKGHPIWERLRDRIQLSKVDMIPDCGDSIEATCQALHFDLGQPLIGEGEPMYALTALFVPATSHPTSAFTRIANVEQLLSQVSLGSQEEIEARLTAYVKDHGDGWSDYGVYHSPRLGFFGRVLDAASGKNALTGDFDKTMAEWFSSYNGLSGVAAETDFYTSLGYDLSAIEQRVQLQPGEMLLIDNFRCIHGREGEREMQETAQFLYGVKEGSAEEIRQYRSWLVEKMA